MICTKEGGFLYFFMLAGFQISWIFFLSNHHLDHLSSDCDIRKTKRGYLWEFKKKQGNDLFSSDKKGLSRCTLKRVFIPRNSWIRMILLVCSLSQEIILNGALFSTVRRCSSSHNSLRGTTHSITHHQGSVRLEPKGKFEVRRAGSHVFQCQIEF